MMKLQLEEHKLGMVPSRKQPGDKMVDPKLSMVECRCLGKMLNNVFLLLLCFYYLNLK